MRSLSFQLLYLLLLLLSLLGLVSMQGCANLQTNMPAPQNQASSWDTRAQTLANLQKWNLSGQVAIRNSKDNITASLHWEQQRQNYTLDFFGPLGSNSFKLTGGAGKVALQNPRGQVFYAASPEILLAQQTGWRLPVSNLYYWIRGLPVPGMPAQKQFDAYHHLVELSQDGWKIQFLRYTAVNQLDLPNKIFISSTDLSVKIIISQWSLA
jgi:outer membrane lipoprotein LolB